MCTAHNIVELKVTGFYCKKVKWNEVELPSHRTLLSGVPVTVPPNIVGESTPQDVSVLLNRQVTLECKSDAVPPPTLTWLKDDQPLQVKSETRQISIDTVLRFLQNVLTGYLVCSCRPLPVCGFSPVVAIYRSTWLNWTTKPSIPAWPATLLAKPRGSLISLSMVRLRILSSARYYTSFLTGLEK